MLASTPRTFSILAFVYEADVALSFYAENVQDVPLSSAVLPISPSLGAHPLS